MLSTVIAMVTLLTDKIFPGTMFHGTYFSILFLFYYFSCFSSQWFLSEITKMMDSITLCKNKNKKKQ